MENKQNKLNSGILEKIKKWLSKERKKKTIILRLMMTIGILFVWLASFIGLHQLHDCNDTGSIILKLICAIAYFCILLIMVAWLFFNIHRFLSKSAKWPLRIFALLFIFGSTFYYIVPVDRDDVNGAEKIEKKALSFERASDQKGTGQSKWRDLLLSAQPLMEAPNRAISAFFPSRGGFEKLATEKEIPYFAFHIAVLLFVAALTFSYFGRGLVNIIRKSIYNKLSKKTLNVFWGLENVGVMLAKDIVDNDSTANEHITFVLPHEMRFNGEQYQAARWKLDELDAPWIFTDFNNLDKNDVYGHRHFFLNISGAVNVSNANRLFLKMQDLGISKPNEMFVYVSMSFNEDARLLSEWADKVKKCFTPIIISEADIIARKFVRDHSILDCPGVEIDTASAKVNGDCKVLLLGFGAIGSRMLREIISNGQFEGGFSLFVDIIEENQAKIEAYKSQHSEAIEKYNIIFKDGVSVEGPGYEDFLANNFKNYNRIIVCLGNDSTNIRVASRLQHFVTDEGIGPKKGVLFVHVTNPNNYLYLKREELLKEKKRLEEALLLNDENVLKGDRKTAENRLKEIEDLNEAEPFGRLSDIYSFDVLNLDPIEEMAKVIHLEWDCGNIINYNNIEWDGHKIVYDCSELQGDKKKNAEEKIEKIQAKFNSIPRLRDKALSKGETLKELKDIIWSEASFLDQESSRASALGQRNLARILGYEFVPQDAEGEPLSQEEYDALLKSNPNKKEQLGMVIAKDEHLRWNAYHRMLGYSRWDLINPPLEREDAKKANKIKKFKKHASLIDFDDLPWLDYRIDCAKDINLKKFDFIETDVDKYKLNINNEENDNTQGNDYRLIRVMLKDAECAGMKLVKKQTKPDEETVTPPQASSEINTVNKDEVKKSIHCLCQSDKFDEAIEMAKNHSIFDEALGEVLFKYGNKLFDDKNYQDAKKKYYGALSIYRTLDNSKPDVYDEYIAKIFKKLGDIHYIADKKDFALSEYREAKKLFVALGVKSPGSYTTEISEIKNTIEKIKPKQQ